MGVNQPQARPRRQVRALASRCARSRRPHPPAEPRFNPARPRGAAGPPAPSGAEPPPPPPDTERCGAERGLPYPGTGAAGGRGNLSAAIAPPEPLLVLRQPPPGQPPPQLPPAPSPSPPSPHSPTAPTVFPPPRYRPSPRRGTTTRPLPSDSGRGPVTLPAAPRAATGAAPPAPAETHPSIAHGGDPQGTEWRRRNNRNEPDRSVL